MNGRFSEMAGSVDRGLAPRRPKHVRRDEDFRRVLISFPPAELPFHRVRERSNAKTTQSHKRYVHMRRPVTDSSGITGTKPIRFWALPKSYQANCYVLLHFRIRLP